MSNILLVDDHQVAIGGIIHALNGLPDFKVIGHVVSAKEALYLIENQVVDLVITDLYLRENDINGIELTQSIKEKYPSIKILMFSSEDKRSQVLRRAYQAGINGYVPKSAPIQELIIALNYLSRGENYFNPQILEKIISTIKESVEPLTPTEKQILTLFADGKSRKEITQEILYRSENTYDKHWQNIKHKLNVKTTVELIQKATRLGLIDLGE